MVSSSSARIPGLLGSNRGHKIMAFSACPRNGAPHFRLLFDGKDLCNFSPAKKRNYWYPLNFIMKEQFAPVVKLANFRPRLVLSERCESFNSGMLLDSDSITQMHHSSDETITDLDDRKKLKQLKISKANKGRIPWNKGKKHTAETLKKIQERTKIAMQDPKVKAKLQKTLRHSQSKETRLKIGIRVREHCQRRRARLLAQEICFFEWQNTIAEASRNVYAGQKELHWNSYEILDKQMKQEWLESIEERKRMRMSKVGMKALKSPEHRRKISEAILAKWTDPVYRSTVCTGLMKYHSAHAGAERKQTKRGNGEAQARRKCIKKKVLNHEGIVKKVTSSKQRINQLFMDRIANSKLGISEKTQEQRELREIDKQEATRRAKLLLEEAERAAKALEMAASKHPIAQASLMEARKFLAEAKQYMRSIEKWQYETRANGDEPTLNPCGLIIGHPQSSLATQERDLSGRQPENCQHQYLGKISQIDVGTNEYGKPNERITDETLMPSKVAENCSSVGGGYDYVAQESTNMCVQLHEEKLDMQQHVNGYSKCNSRSYRNPELETRTVTNKSSASAGTKIKKKWVRGRLVEVQVSEL